MRSAISTITAEIGRRVSYTLQYSIRLNDMATLSRVVSQSVGRDISLRP